jgi:hypothetical protein
MPICENAVPTSPTPITMSSPEKVLKALAEKFAAITTRTDAFCEKRLNDEYQQLIQPKND